MKIRNTILFLLMVNLAFGQKGKNDPYNRIESPFLNLKILADKDTDFKIYTPLRQSRENFIENGINTVSAYSYPFDENGNMESDSFLIYKELFDIQENKIIGTHEGRDHFGIHYNAFEIYYDTAGQIIRYRRNSGWYPETDYEYDSLNNVIKETDKGMEYDSKRDTMVYSGHIGININEYVYNSNNQKVEWTQTVIHETINLKRKKTKKIITDCEPKRLIAKWEYDSLSNLTGWISFTKDSSIYYKRNFFYDYQNRVILQSDSSRKTQVFGIYMSEPYCEKIITYEYTDTGKIETRIKYYRAGEAISVKITLFYNNDDEVVEAAYWNETGYHIEYFYFYENNKLIKETAHNISTIDILYPFSVGEKMYYYNEKGLLKEEVKTLDSKIKYLTRYYYE